MSLFGFAKPQAPSSSAELKTSTATSEFIPDDALGAQALRSEKLLTDEQVSTDQSLQHSGSPFSTSTPTASDAAAKTSSGRTPAPIEILYVNENPLSAPAVRPTGTFGPLPMRTNTDKLLYGTGLAYLTGRTLDSRLQKQDRLRSNAFMARVRSQGLSYGAVYGFYRGLQTAQVPNFRVRFNSVLNQATRYGPWAANSLGVMTLGWALLDNTFSMVRGDKSDYFNHIAAAFASGVIFKSTAGIRPALVTGTILAATVSSYGVLEVLTNASSKATTVASGTTLSNAST
eukprot:jgi/Hompol1/567/HPOL_002550-RA